MGTGNGNDSWDDDGGGGNDDDNGYNDGDGNSCGDDEEAIPDGVPRARALCHMINWNTTCSSEAEEEDEEEEAMEAQGAANNHGSMILRK